MFAWTQSSATINAVTMPAVITFNDLKMADAGDKMTNLMPAAVNAH